LAINHNKNPQWIEEASLVIAVQSKTMSPANVEASMSICQKPKLFSRGPHQGFKPFMAWSALVVKFWSHSSDATSTLMSFMEELVLKVNLEDPFFIRRYAPKC
jgi:hypothetical protein